MRSFQFKGKPQRLSKYLNAVLPELRFGYFHILLKQKDVSVNGRRINTDVYLQNGDEVTLYCDETKLVKFAFEKLYSDANVMLALKPRGVSSEEFARRVCSADNKTYFLAHRLDTNTQGLLLFACTEAASKELYTAFKRGWIHKKYVALLVGNLTEEMDLHAFLVKNADESEVTIFDKKVEDSVPIHTGVKPLENRGDVTLAEVTLYTGKTHQIRAHLSHIGYPIVGDCKYGDFEYNRTMRARRQYLTAYKMSFDFPPQSKLRYLNGKEFSTKADF